MLKDGSKLDILSFLELIASEDEKPRQQDWIDREGKQQIRSVCCGDTVECSFVENNIKYGWIDDESICL